MRKLGDQRVGRRQHRAPLGRGLVIIIMVATATALARRARVNSAMGRGQLGRGGRTHGVDRYRKRRGRCEREQRRVERRQRGHRVAQRKKKADAHAQLPIGHE
jgi:hypothetical protein